MLLRSGRGFNREAAKTAISRALALLGRLAPRDFPHGVLLFCSGEVAEAVHPPKSLSRGVYRCGRAFDTSELRADLEALNTSAYHIIVIDGAAALLGTVQGLHDRLLVRQLGRILPARPIASRTRRGGQSALRYDRLRDEAELAFLRRVVEKAAPLLESSPGFILAGKANMKRQLFTELPQVLRSRVLCTVDLACGAEGGQEALYQAAAKAADVVCADRGREMERAVGHFLELTRVNAALCCYGETETAAALQFGAVERLLIDACSRTLEEWRALAQANGAIVVEVAPRSEETVEFCRSFSVGGCLRWPVELELLEDEGPSLTQAAGEAVAGSPADEIVAPAARPVVELSAVPFAESAAASSSIFAWLQQQLTDCMEHPSEAEALAIGVEVIVGGADGATELEVEEALAQALEMLRGEGVPPAMIDEFANRWAAEAAVQP